MQFTPSELGFAQSPPPADSTGLPPGGAQWVTPQFLTFAALQQSGFNGFRWTHDEALAHSGTNARAMRNDPVIVEALRARQMPTAMLSWHLEPQDEGDAAQEAAIPLLEDILRGFGHFQQFRRHLLEALWYGRAGCQIRYRWDYTKPNPFTGGRRLIPTGYQYVNGDKLRFKWDGTPGVLVHGTFPGEKESTDYGYAHFLTGTEREAFCVHRFEPEDADWYDTHLAGGIHGYGIRGRIYWYWYLKSQLMAMVVNYAERFANGLTLWYYDASNSSAKTEMLNAVTNQQGQINMVIPRWGAGRDQNAVERLEVGTANPQFLLSIVDNLDSAMRRYILGQTLTSDTAPTGLGSGVAEAHSDTLSKIIKYDACDLEATLTEDLIAPLCRYNCPGVKPPRFRFDVDTPNATEVLGNAQILQSMGLAVDGEHLYDVAGLPKPAQGDTALSKLQPQSAVGPGVGPDPEGVPSAGDSLPPEAEPEQATYQSGDRVQYRRRLAAKIRSLCRR